MLSVPADKAGAVIAVLKREGETAMRVGEVTKFSSGKRVTYSGKLDLS